MYSLSENKWGFRVIGSIGSPPDFHTILMLIKVMNMEEQNCTSRAMSLTVRFCRLSTVVLFCFCFSPKKSYGYFSVMATFTFFHVPIISVNNFLCAYFICSTVFLHVPILYVKIKKSCAYFICSLFFSLHVPIYVFNFLSMCLFDLFRFFHVPT